MLEGKSLGMWLELCDQVKDEVDEAIRFMALDDEDIHRYRDPDRGENRPGQHWPKLNWAGFEPIQTWTGHYIDPSK